MQLEQVKPNKPSFGLVVALSAVALIIIFVGAWLILEWSGHQKKKPPFTKHPVSQLALPFHAQNIAA